MSFAQACRAADKKQRKPVDTRLRKLRQLLADDISLDRAWHELNRPSGVPAATIKTAEYLVQQGDAERFRSWLDRRSADERTAIRRHLEAKQCH